MPGGAAIDRRPALAKGIFDIPAVPDRSQGFWRD